MSALRLEDACSSVAEHGGENQERAFAGKVAQDEGVVAKPDKNLGST